MLELKQIKKSYIVGESRQEVLKGIDIKFRRNEFTSILGSSGSGKTTLLNIIGGLDKYDSGDLVIEGTSTEKYSDRDWDAYRNYRVGFIFQSYNLIMHQSVLQNVEIALTLSGVSKDERKKRATDALEKVGLLQHINKKPNQLSGGQMQRVAIARALVNNPEIILADEPTGALDSETSVQIMDLLKKISKDKLVIMVTHNPQLAKDYSTRIIELKDGVIIDDTDPYEGEKAPEVTKEVKKTSMSLRSALSLSFNNLLTKKGRTFLTAFAGSIGIIGIALILALSNGVNNYARNLEKDSLTEYPIEIQKVSYDVFGSIGAIISEAQNAKEHKDGKLYSQDDVVKASVISSELGVLQKNDIKSFKNYVDSTPEFSEYSQNIVYSYNLALQVYNDNYKKVNPSNLLPESSNNLFQEMIERDGKYKVLEGTLPENKDEVVLVIGPTNTVKDSILYSLGLRDESQLEKDMKAISDDKNYRVEEKEYSYRDIIGKKFKLILNTDYYKVDGDKILDMSEDASYMKDIIDGGMNIKIVGVVKDDSAGESFIGYKHDLTLDVVNNIAKTELYKMQMDNPGVNVLTKEPFDEFSNTYQDLVSKLGIYDIDEPASISLYPKDYESKEKIEKLIEDYNKKVESEGKGEKKIEYADMMKSLIGGVTKVISIVSYILIAFVSISLIVSSIMIGIITYISVLERTKEIGILRAIGASKKDIKRVFRAETIIEGFVAGVIGVVIALLLSLVINMIVGAYSDIKGVASLSLLSAIVLIILSILLNVLAGTRPSKIAAKKDPVEALRTE